MDEAAFRIEILQQGWLTDDADMVQDDLCSHGRIRLIIAGRAIANETEKYGISETALALLRTLARDHSPTDCVAQILVFHGCGTILMMGCPIGIDWSVQHVPGARVRLSDVRRFDTTNEADVVRFPGLSAELGEREYREAVVAFAREAKGLFAGVPKTIEDEWERQQYEQFWQEYDELLARFG